MGAGIVCRAQLAMPAYVSGTIKDAAKGDALIGATVFADSIPETVTDLDGSFTIELSQGMHILRFNYVGYLPQEKTVTLRGLDTLHIEISLEVDQGILNTVVITGSKFEKKLGEETVTMDVIKSDLIDNANDVSIDNSIDKVPGVNIIDGQCNIRGGSGYSYGAGSRVLLLMDDLPILTGDAAYPSWDFIPIENIEQVEIIKGASSALYGSSALNGIVNVRTAYPTSTPVTKFSFFSGAYFHPADTSQKWWDDHFPFFTGASFAHRQKFGKFDLVTGAYLYNEDSYLQGDYDRRIRGNINTRYRINSRLAAGLNINAQVSRSSSFFFWDDIDSLYSPEPNTLSINRGYKMTVDPFMNYSDEKGNRHKILLRYFRSHNNNQSDQATLGDMLYGEYQYQKHFSITNTVLTGGILAQHDIVKAQLYGDSTYTSSNEAAYLQVDQKFWDRLNLGGGVRYEMNQIGDQKEARPVFRVGANYQLGKSTYVRASWGQGYRFPTIAEKYIHTNIGVIQILPDPDLKSETGWSAEGGIKQGFRIGGWQGYADVSGFISEYFDMMEFTFNYYPGEGVGFKSLNIGNTKIQGVEFTVAGKGKIGNTSLELLAGYTYIDPKFQDFDVEKGYSSVDYNVLKYRFKNTAKADVQADYRHFKFGATMDYFSYMEAIDNIFNVFIDGLKEFRSEHDNGDIVFDARIGYMFNGNHEISLICNNLLNREYSVRPAIMEAPRNFTVKYSVKM